MATTTNESTTEETPPSSPMSENGASSYGTAGGNNASNELLPSMQSTSFPVWRKPWMAALVFFFVFYMLWFQGVIIQRYWIDEKWEFALPGLGKTALRKFTIRMHMTLGGLAIICSPIQMVTPFTSMHSKSFPVWRKPWMAALVFFFVFYMLWFQGVIIQRYWIDEKWEFALPGLGKTALRKFTIRMHMTLGGLAIICSPIQMVTPFTSGWKKEGISMTRDWYRRIHRYSGRFYVACAILSFLFGQWFICLKKFMLVGGYNMGVAFSFAGFFIAYFAYMTWKTAPGKNSSGRYTVEDHRNYAIRSFSQIIAPVLYRYWYGLLAILNVYRTPYFNGGDAAKGEKLVCDGRDVCEDYERRFDALYAWLYWISAWIVAEVVIACLPRHQKQTITPVSVSGDEKKVPLLTNLEPTVGDDISDTDSGDANAERNEIQNDGVSARAIAYDKNNNKPATLVVNIIGCLLAVLAAMVSVPFLLMKISDVIKK